MTDQPQEPGSLRYPIPASTHEVELVVQKSRFIASAMTTKTVEEANAAIDGVRQKYPDATHHCWAYLIGPPGDSRCVGLSDDGEPHGTAGKPMLNALLHGPVGDVTVVVTRYFGGRKLGTGGLVRAYGGAVQRVLETLPQAQRIETRSVTCRVPYDHLNVFQALKGELGFVVETETYDQAALFGVRVAVDTLAEMVRRLLDMSSGQIEIIETLPR